MWQLLDTMSMHVTPYTTTSYYRCVTLTLHVIQQFIFMCTMYIYVLGIK